jgi:hypothetical protein
MVIAKLGDVPPDSDGLEARQQLGAEEEPRWSKVVRHSCGRDGMDNTFVQHWGGLLP